MIYCYLNPSQLGHRLHYHPLSLRRETANGWNEGTDGVWGVDGDGNGRGGGWRWEEEDGEDEDAVHLAVHATNR